MKGKEDQPANEAATKTRLERAEVRAEQAEARTEQAKTRTEMAETRTEHAEARTEQAKTRTEMAETRTEQAEIRTEQAETRTEQAEAALANAVHPEGNRRRDVSARLHKDFSGAGSDGPVHPLEQLTSRQRETLQLIAEGLNTKQIAEILKVRPKTVEYHRMKLMAGLNLHDIPGLVRYAMRVGLIAMEANPTITTAPSPGKANGVESTPQ